jgi:hypothetical protein
MQALANHLDFQLSLGSLSVVLAITWSQLQPIPLCKIIKHALASRIRLQKLPNKTAAPVDEFAKNCIAPGVTITSNDGNEFTNLRNLGYDHQAVPMRGDRVKMDSYLPI